MNSPNKFRNEKEEMISLFRSRGIKDESVLSVMKKIERQLFVDEAFVPRSYEDCALPISNSQTISQPYTVAVMTELLQIKKGDKILEIGTGSGYQAAILAELGARVFTIERFSDLLTKARLVFAKLGYNIASKTGDGTIGWSEFAPFDGIIVTAAAPEIPEPLLKQLANSGKLIIPVGDLNSQNIIIVTNDNGEFVEKKIEGFKFVPLVGKLGWK
ncbi:MAG: protein-L-isoaspartate(D-aspartate) O-methyltransferase [Ignavibacteriales bacterium]|nr:protein-L-isoaspartate(D-aspartate) O-methyltransferase [Ignavibacteriales bacterium]